MSPLELFRRNQKVTMTFLILLAMFAFVVLPTVSEYMRRSGPGMTDPVLAEFNGVSLTASRVNGFTQKHYATVQYLRKLAEETMRRGGTPKVPGFVYDQQSNQIQSVGINGSPSDDMSVRTMQFAAEAQKQGFELDDTSLAIWLEQFTDGTMSEREMFALLRRETNNQMGQYQLYDMLRKQLLSALYFRGASATVARGQFPLQSPLDHWNNFLKLNQKATVNAYGVLVNDYVDETDANPSESDVVTVYEAGKDRYPSDQSPEPGFRRRETASFEYLLGELQAFRDAEVAKLSEEEIKAEYERRKAGGAFQLPPDVVIEPEAPETPAAGETAAEAEMNEAKTPENTSEAAPTAATPPAEMKDEAASEPETPAEKASEEPADDDQEASAEAKAAEQKQVEEFSKELEEAGNLDVEATEETATEDAATEETPDDAPESDDQSSTGRDSSGVRLVAMQSDASTETADASTADEAETDAVEAEETAAEETTAEESTPEPRYRPFEEVRDQIAQTMVDAPAREARDAAIAKARNVMRKYSRARAIYGVGGDDATPAPERPNLKALADELGLTHRKIGPFDPVSLADEPIANSVEESTALTQRGVPFAAMMFGIEGQVIKQELFTPATSVDLETQRTYLSWKTDEKEAYTPELDEVRDEVVAAIRFTQARELAKQAAAAMAESANGGTDLDQLVPEDRKENYYKDLGPFSWLNMVGFGSFTIGNIPELDSIDEDFMKTVFNADGGEHVVAPNGPKRVFYVVKRTSLQPATSDLRAIFSQQSERIIAMFMSDGTAAKVQQGFFDSIDDETGFQQYQLPQ
ncbi:hypothetical protein Mal15_08100 [Stieleria maiorica]|uniref:Periplasmic folding chaperone n=1 Tax=Stieleria maiorica TaxID=2795974 RepID=A0A5B9M9Q4_9BACT|nr:hypothetical protein [Stieleria maiorica]QEF96780.1 hypothetical protein Mal15_08100 [Stieleria maiorica]